MAPDATALWDMGLPSFGVRMASLEYCCRPREAGFTLIRQRHTDAARSVLLSPEYEKQRQLVVQGIQAFLDDLRRSSIPCTARNTPSSSGLLSLPQLPWPPGWVSGMLSHAVDITDACSPPCREVNMRTLREHCRRRSTLLGTVRECQRLYLHSRHARAFYHHQ